jgi:hypothetical protein
MGEVSTIGLDIAKSVFQVHGVDDAGAVVIRRRISRAKVLEFFGGLSPCLIGGHRTGCRDRRLEAVPIGPQSCRLDRTGAEAALDRRQGAARQHHQAGQSLLAMAAGCRRHGRYSICAAAWHQAGLAHTNHGAPARKGRRGRARQQDRADGLGHYGPWREIPGAKAVAGSVNTPFGEGMTT